MDVCMDVCVHTHVECASPYMIHLGSWEAGCLQFRLAETVLVYVSLWA